ncbi:LacI family transcriptional regulator [Stieleria sp. TO1_6]|uniref:LacI family DNA-binding transcriptional regulator n=1 Tax=Stieleria tagensis TaxID=2956795 RepID=UPI00209B160D|nr:LacI family DNA-binding transcriptional regulator [Stieleria tagensis]MCO8123634.1 LacI family transcriptional regulator [Stieleria tagensis]
MPSPEPLKSGPITLRIVAEAAGVSISTASRALNGQAREYRISKATEEAVQRVAAELGFQPSQVARSLRLKRSGLVGVIVPDISNPFFSAIAREVSLGVEAAGYSVLLGDSREETTIEKRLVAQLQARQVEALLVCPVGLESQHLVQLDQSGLPVVVADRVFEDIQLSSVTSDNVAAGRIATQVLIDHGHRHFGVVSGVRESLPTRHRLQGIRQAMLANGLELDASSIAGDSYTNETGYQSTRELLGRHPEITALFAMCAPLAAGVLRALSDLGYAIPMQMSVVSIDDHPFAELMKTPLTAAAQNIEQLGRVAAEVLLERLKQKRAKDKTLSTGPGRGPVCHQVPASLLERASVAAPRPTSEF